MGIVYTGSGPLGSAIAMDKGLSRKLFAADGVPVAKGIVVKRSGRASPLQKTGSDCRAS